VVHTAFLISSSSFKLGVFHQCITESSVAIFETHNILCLLLDWSEEVKGLSHDVVMLWKTHRYSTLLSVSFELVSATCGTVVGVNETLVEDKMCKFTLESTHIIVNKCPIYTHDYSEVNAAALIKSNKTLFLPFITITYQKYFQ
jgi:hypothetical protein